jgi:adenylylsulfate kinase
VNGAKRKTATSLVYSVHRFVGRGQIHACHAVEEQLHQLGCRTFVFDGDNVRHGLLSSLGFSEDDRRENIHHIGEAAKLMTEAGVRVLTAFMSPFRADREAVRNLMPYGDLLEIYFKASLETCVLRDVKGLYKKARAGEIKNFTGIDSSYESSGNAEL